MVRSLVAVSPSRSLRLCERKHFSSDSPFRGEVFRFVIKLYRQHFFIFQMMPASYSTLFFEETRTLHLSVFMLLAALIMSGCSLKADNGSLAESGVDLNLLLTLPEQPISFSQDIKPVLDNRCVVCHGCYDAPCQLKLSSIEGIQRGASKQLVYDGSRILGTEPTRLMIDASTAEEWRGKGFHAVLNETGDSATENLQQSVLYQLLRLKQFHPQPRVGRLPASIDLALNRDQVCPLRDEFDRYAQQHPLWGMPYAMPNLSDREYRLLVQWLAQGSPVSPQPEPSPEALNQIADWEQFLNGSSNKQKLVSRYLYEHLFQGHIHFVELPGREFYRLVRSTTPSGQAVAEIPTIRPYDHPGTDSFYYRLIPYHASIVAKDHVVYQLSSQKMARYRELFYQPDYPVDSLPSYDAEVASNPFKAFRAIPPESRYRFLLDNARFFVEGFIKGPVCRGQIALNVIEDQFWVLFFDPDNFKLTTDAAFLDRYADSLDIPSELGDTFQLLAAWTEYWDKLKTYKKAVQNGFLEQATTTDLQLSMKLVWDGDGTNPNAALTVFRHDDSASVNHGLSGSYPETAWIIDYPMLERIHYLLVAGFNVFGNVGHQLNTRIYMDFLRMEGENHFLAFLPVKQRKKIRDSWYTGIRDGMDKYLHAPEKWLDKEFVTGYQSSDPQTELYQQIEHRLGAMAGNPDYLNRCQTPSCQFSTTRRGQLQADSAMAKVAKIKGAILQVFPDLTFIRVRSDNNEKEDLSYTLIRNKAFKNLNTMFSSEADDVRDLELDTLTVLPGLYGSYPNFFFDIELAQVDDFVERYVAIRDFSDYEKFVSLYGVRRTRPDFWQIADWFQQESARQQPVLSGLYDLNRYSNR